MKIARQMGLPEEKIELLREAALLHDIGKLGIQDMILSKKVVLTNEDWHIIHKHPEIGEEILRPISLDIELLAVVRGHHERYDGKGYPDGLKGDKIDILTAIVAAADSYDAMVSNRAYKNNMTETDAIEQLKANRGLQFDPKVIDAFIEVLEKEGGIDAFYANDSLLYTDPDSGRHNSFGIHYDIGRRIVGGAPVCSSS